jgi:hypothetical protein
VFDTTVVGRFLIRVTHESPTSAAGAATMVSNCGETPAGLGRNGKGYPLLVHSNAFQLGPVK